MDEIELNVEGTALAARLFRPTLSTPVDGGFPAALFIHGSLSSQESYAQYAALLANMGILCLTFDMRGCGQSGGDSTVLSRQDHLQDTIAAFDCLAGQPLVNSQRIIVVGSSFGGYLAALLSSSRRPRGLVLRVPADYPDEGMDRPYAPSLANDDRVDWASWALRPHPPTETMAMRALAAFEGEVLVVESGADETVPHQVIANLLVALGPAGRYTHVVMQNAPHRLGDEGLRQEYEGILVRWLRRVVGLA